MKTTKIWTWVLGAVAALAVADAPDEPSAAVPDEHGGGVTNRLAGAEADIAAVRGAGGGRAVKEPARGCG